MNAEGKRADPFAEMNLDEFEPTPAAPRKPPVEKAALKQISEANNFPSRAPVKKIEAQPNPASGLDKGQVNARPARRHRTGRNVQFNIKTTHETIERFVAIADRENWVLGETLEKALDALEGKLKH